MVAPFVFLLAGLVAGGATGGKFGDLMGGTIDEERQHMKAIADEYQANMQKAETQYNDTLAAGSIARLVNPQAFFQEQNKGLRGTYMTDLRNAFKMPEDLKYKVEPQKDDEDDDFTT
jgi:hypothetical protein